jgi:DNA-binding MarR family transcriptional regulator
VVRRRRDPEDGRASLLTLTAKGRQQTEACFPAFESAIGAFRKALADEGMHERDVVDVLEAVSRAIAKATTRLEDES